MHLSYYLAHRSISLKLSALVMMVSKRSEVEMNVKYTLAPHFYDGMVLMNTVIKSPLRKNSYILFPLVHQSTTVFWV